MTTSQQPQPETPVEKPKDPLAPPPEFSDEPRWVVRLDGADVGPLSSQELYPKFLVGELDPDTLLMDDIRFVRKRLKDITEFKPYLELHNTQNPILLKEKERQKRDRDWELKGKSRLKIASLITAIVLVAGGVTVKLLLPDNKGKDFFLAEGDTVIGTGNMKVFDGLPAPKVRAGKRRRRRRRARKVARRNGSKGSKARRRRSGGSTVSKVNLNGKGPMVPIKAIQASIGRNIRQLVPCLRQEIRRNPNFGGRLTVRFTVQGTGRVSAVGIEDTTFDTGKLQTCIRAKSSSWDLVRFSGVATVYYPFTIRRRTRW